MEKELIYKSRSFSSCILAAYKLLSENMKSIIRCTWLPVVLLGLFGGVCMALNVHNEQIIQAGIAHTGIYIAAVLCSSIAIIACSLWATSRLMSLFNEEPRRWNFVRILKLWLNAFVICLIVGGVLALLFVAAVKILKCSPMMFIVDNWLAVLALVVIIGLLLLPLNYICMRYLFDRKARFWKDLPKTYLTGLRHLSFIFLTALICGIIVGIIALIIYLPLMILLTANTMSTIGMISGDPSGIPGYFPLLIGATACVVILLVWYVSAFQFITYLFMYGSIEKQREERRNTAIIPTEDINETLYRP